MCKRKLGDPAPDRMYINQGEVKMVDGSDVEKYLADWQFINGFKNGTQVCIVTKDDLERLEKNIKFLLAFTFC